ncbi:MAG: SdrD B-like domain-containing protein [Arachnia sp.]
MVLAAALVATLNVASPAAAAELTGVITNITVERVRENPPDEIDVLEQLRIKANWSVANPRKDDSFSMTLPSEFGAGVISFDLKDPTQTITLAKCTVTNQSSAPTMTCILTAEAEAFGSISNGNLWLLAQARATTDSNKVTFTVDGTPVVVPLPGTKIVATTHAGPKPPTTLEKGAWINAAWGSMSWMVKWPGSFVTGDSITFTDELIIDAPTYEAHAGQITTPRLQVWNPDTQRFNNIDGEFIELEWNETRTAFTATITYDFQADGAYAFEYRTKPVGPAVYGDVYRNKITAEGKTVYSDREWNQGGGGDGSGLGRFALTKSVTGDAAPVVPDDAAYTISYSFGDQTREMTVTEGSQIYSERVAADTEITLTEVEFPDIAGVEWGTPTFSGVGVTDNGDGTATITPEGGKVIEIGLNNVANSNAPKLVSVGDFTWFDSDSDGVQDQGEPVVPGVTVNLYAADGVEVLDSVVTDDNGFYSFTGLTPDTGYVMEFVAPDGYVFTLQSSGDDVAQDSDADRVTGRVSFTSRASGENRADTPDDPTIDAGFVEQPVDVEVELASSGEGDKETTPVAADDVVVPSTTVAADEVKLPSTGSNGATLPLLVVGLMGLLGGAAALTRRAAVRQ